MRELPGDEEPVDLLPLRLLRVWLATQRELQEHLAGLTAAGPAGEQRVGRDLVRVAELEERAHRAFAAYRDAVDRRTLTQSRSDGGVLP